MRITAIVNGEIYAGQPRAGVFYLKLPMWVKDYLVRNDIYPFGEGRFLYKRGSDSPDNQWIAEFEDYHKDSER
jgi:hypothetical protein